MYIAPGQTASRGQNFDVNKNVLSLHSFVARLKKISVKSDFIQIFHDFIHVYVTGNMYNQEICIIPKNFREYV